MKRQRVESSTIKSVGYDEPTRTLEIEFNSGGIYSYAEVPPIAYEVFMRHPSKGSFFANEIKPKHACTVIFKREKKEKNKDGQDSTGTPPQNRGKAKVKPKAKA